MSNILPKSHYLLTVCTFLGSFSLVFGCGLKSNSTKDGRSYSEPKSGALAPKKPSSVKLSGPLLDYQGALTNARTFALTTVYVPSEDLSGEDPKNPMALVPQIRVKVLDSQNMVQWEKIQHFKEIKWDIPLAQSGVKTVLVESISADGKSEILLKKAVDADFDPPKLIVNSLIGSRLENGDRPISVMATISGEKSVECGKAEVKLLGEPQSLFVDLSRDTQLQDKEAIALRGHLFLKDQSIKGTPLVSLICKDAAGNSQEVREPAYSKPVSYQFSFDVNGPSAPMPVNSETLNVTFLKKPELDLMLYLTDAQGAAVPETLLGAIKEEFLIYLTDKAPESLEDLAQQRNILWTQSFEKMVNIKIPPQLMDLHVLYLSLVHKDPVIGQDVLLSSIRLPIFVDKMPPKVTLDPKMNLNKAEFNATIDLAAKVEIEGAPLRSDGIQVELTLDGKNWTTVPSTVSGADQDRIFSFKYPFASEMPIRARIKATDLAGSEAFSDTSGQLVGFDPKHLATPFSERNGCLGPAGAQGAKLKPWRASKFLCRKDDGKGGLSSTQYAVLIFQNRGQVVPSFYQSASVKQGLGYKVIVDGVEVFDSRIEPPTSFGLNKNDFLIYHIPLQTAWQAGNLIELRTDIEASGVNSTTNSCYQNDMPYGSVVLMDKAQNDVLTLQAFKCGAEGTMAYAD